jgi:sugar lactone lactonase YvrE
LPILIAAVALITWLAAAPAVAMVPHLESELASLDVGDPLPRIVCPEGFEAFVYATGLQSPNGLAFDLEGVLHVTEEKTGRVLRIGPGGTVTPVVTGLASPEGIAFDPAGNLYVTEDVQNGRLLRVDPGGGQTVLATNLDAPESVVWSPDDHLYITQSNVQFVENVPWDVVTRVTRVSQGGDTTDILTDALFWSYSAIDLGADGLLYVANEASNVGTTDSVFRVDPATGVRTLFVSDLTIPEGVHFSLGGVFPLYVTEEDLGDGSGRLSLVRADGTHAPLCTGFSNIEDVSLDDAGNLYISEDGTRQIVQIIAPDLVPPGPPQNLLVDPPGWTAANGFALSWENPRDTSGIAGAYLKLDAPPTSVTDGTFYAGEELAQISGITATGAGAHPAFLWLEDGVGNADHTNSATAMLRYDPDPPGSPIDLVADPDDWTPANDFTLTWTNPPELSGVMTACYRLDAPPVTVADFEACQPGADIETFTGVTVTDSGQYPAYLWLADAAGNVDPATAVSTTLRLDTLPPVSAASAPETTHVAPIRVTWVATDTHSGVETVALWVKIGDGGTWTDSGLSARAGGMDFFLYEPAGEGLYYFATLALDQAGNAEAEPTGDGDARTRCQTWQRVYLPLMWKAGP